MSNNIQLNEILKIFCEVQRLNKASHFNNLQLLVNICENNDFEQFKDDFLHVLLLLQLNADFKKLNPFYDNVFDFWTHFLTRLDKKKENELKQHLLKEFIEYADHSNENLRFRICESILAIFKSDMNFIEALSEEDVEELRECILERVKDVKNPIKLKTIEIMKFLQDIEDPDDPIVYSLLEQLIDSNVKNRLAAVDAIAPVPSAIQPLLDRIRDVNEKVRIATCEKFTKIPVQSLSIVQRHTIIRNGLKDFCEEVKKCIEEKVLPWWLECYDNDYFKLMNALLLDGNSDELKETKKLTKNILKSLFRTQPVVTVLEQLELDSKLLKVDKINWSRVLYWHCLIQHFSDESDTNQFVEQILPETKDYCEYLTSYYNTNKHKSMSKWEYEQFQLILEELVCLALLCDITDECNRLLHRKTLLELLKGDVSNDIVSIVFSHINKTMPNVDQRTTFICEFISEMRNKSDNNVSEQDYAEYAQKTSDIRKEINKLTDEQRSAIKELDLQKAEHLKNEIERLRQEFTVLNETMNKEQEVTKNNDPQVIYKCANIVVEMLQAPDIVKLNSSLKTLRDEMFKDLMLVNDTKIQSKIMQCYVILSLFEKETALACIKLFAPILLPYRDQISEVDECILVTIINSVTDIILMWGKSAFVEEEPKDLDTSGELEQMFSSISYEECIQILVFLMEDKNNVVRETAGIAVTKILDMDRIESPLILSRLILKWFNPITAENDLKLHQYLGVFLVNFNLEPHGATQYRQAFIPTLSAVCTAPISSPLANISIDKLIKFLAHVTSPGITQKPELHEEIAKLLVQEIENDTYMTKPNIVYSKALLTLEVFRGNEEFIDSMLEKCQELINEIEETSNSLPLKRNIHKFIYQIQDSISNKPVTHDMKKENVENEKSEGSEDEE